MPAPSKDSESSVNSSSVIEDSPSKIRLTFAFLLIKKGQVFELSIPIEFIVNETFMPCSITIWHSEHFPVIL